MYFTDRGIEELEQRRGDDEVTVAWLAEQLRVFVDPSPSSKFRSNAWPPGWRASTTTPTTTSPPAERSATEQEPRPMTSTPLDQRVAAVRTAFTRPVRPRTRGGLACSRTGQPHRRAHRLQRRLRPAVRARAVGARRRRVPRRTASCGSRHWISARPTSWPPTRSCRDLVAGRPTSRARSGRCGTPAPPRAGSTSCCRPTCRWARDCRVRRPSSARSWPRRSTCSRSTSHPSTGRACASGPRTSTSVPPPACSTRRRPPCAPTGMRCSSTAAASSRGRCRCRWPTPGSRSSCSTPTPRTPTSTASTPRDGRRASRRRASSGLPALRDVVDLDDALHRLDDDLLRRRVRHVVSENARVLETVELAATGRLEEIAPLLDASHASMRDDFEITVATVDLAVSRRRATPAPSAPG